jgi:hypothetical protein
MPILEVIIVLVVLVAVVLALVFQRRRIENVVAQQQEWERSNQSHLRTWESQQEKRITDLEARLTAEFQEVQQARQKWETKDAVRMEELEKEYKAATAQLRLHYELARVLRIEDTPLRTDLNGQTRPGIANWRPSMLYQADLRGLELSHRYLGHADMREAQLAGATLFMSNLSRANLSGADLSNTDLSGADLSGADLRNATFTGTNLLVADLHNADLTGANLLGVRNLTSQQLRHAIFDDTTLMDAEIDATPHRVEKVRGLSEMTSPRMETVSPIAPSLPATPAPVSAESSTGQGQAQPLLDTKAAPVAQKQEPEIAEPVAVAVPEQETQIEVLSSSLIPDTTSFIQYLDEPVASSSPAGQEPEIAEPVAVAAPEQETQVEVLSSSLIPDTTSFIEQMDEGQVQGLPLQLSALTSGDSLLDPNVADLLVDTSESKDTGGSDTAPPRRKYNGKRTTKRG